MTETVLIQQNIALVLSEIPKETTFQSQLEKRASTPELSREKLAELYLETLTPKERKSYLIAKEHLGMSFTLEKSVGFLKWKKSTFDT